MVIFYFFFFQAEDGIRDYKVTGVQTCALPICAANDIEAIAVEAREIASVEPALAIDGLRRQIRGAVVAAHDVAAANVKLADFTFRHRYAVERPDASLDARQQRPYRMIGARRIEAHSGYSGRTFGDAVAVRKRQAEFLFDARLQIEIERSPGHRDQTQRSAVELPETGHCL